MKISTIEQLREIYPQPNERAKGKVLTELEEHSIRFIESSPFMLISSCDDEGNVDVSPKGGEPGYVKIWNSTTLLIPDLSGNNRLDNLINVISTGKAGSIFLIPGLDETLRVNGSAYISTEEKYMSVFDTEFKPPKSCIVLEINEVFLHCAKAFMRSDLWGETNRINKNDFPSIGKMLKDQLKLNTEVETRKDMIDRYLKEL